MCLRMSACVRVYVCVCPRVSAFVHVCPRVSACVVLVLYIPRVKTKAGTRAFSVAAPTVWNSLPASVKSEGSIVSLRRRIKTYLVNAAYPP